MFEHFVPLSKEDLHLIRLAFIGEIDVDQQKRIDEIDALLAVEADKITVVFT